MAKAGRPPRQPADAPYPNNLLELRQRAGVTQLVVADALGVQGAAYSKMERGQHRIPADRITALCRVLNCSPVDIDGIGDALPGIERAALDMLRSLPRAQQQTWIELGRTLLGNLPKPSSGTRRPTKAARRSR